MAVRRPAPLSWRYRAALAAGAFPDRQREPRRLEASRMPDLQSPQIEREIAHHAARALQRFADIVLPVGLAIQEQVSAAARAHQLAPDRSLLASDLVQFVRPRTFSDIRIHELLVHEALMQQFSEPSQVGAQ